MPRVTVTATLKVVMYSRHRADGTALLSLLIRSCNSWSMKIKRSTVSTDETVWFQDDMLQHNVRITGDNLEKEYDVDAVHGLLCRTFACWCSVELLRPGVQKYAGSEERRTRPKAQP